MAATIGETNRRREKQLRYNAEHGITPTQIKKNSLSSIVSEKRESSFASYSSGNGWGEALPNAAEPETLTIEEKRKRIASLKKQMQEAAKRMEFVDAALLRDEMLRLQAELNE
jgi:excinuclease ABC subunit B